MDGVILDGPSRVAILKRWARVFPDRPLPEFGKLPFMAAVELEQKDPELATVLQSSRLPADLELQLREGTWPDTPNPENLPSAAAERQKAAVEDQLRGMDEAAAALRAHRTSAERSQVELEMLEASRRSGRDFARAQNAAGFRAACGLQ